MRVKAPAQLTEAAHKDSEVVAIATAALRDMTTLAKSMRYATILTEDGFEVVGVPAHKDGRLATMASSIQALSEAVAGELAIGSERYVIVAADAGHVVQLRVPGQRLVLAALFDVDETLGKALSTSRITAERFAAALAER